MILNWSHLNIRRQNLDFDLSNTVVAIDLFLVVAVAVAAAAVVIPVFVAVGKDTHKQWTFLNCCPY